MNFMLGTREAERSSWRVRLQQREYDALIRENTRVYGFTKAPYTNDRLN
jgi:hypothetical protein